MPDIDLFGLQQEPISVEVVDTAPVEQKYLIAAQEKQEDLSQAVDMERERRKSELQLWASKQRLISNAPPTVKQLYISG